MRAVGVIRLSELTAPTTSPARQREIITASAFRRGDEIAGWAEDLNVSATVYAQRPATRAAQVAGGARELG
jgi:hypothetical protein